MRFFAAFSLIIILSSGALAETVLKDVPDWHWAKEAVYDLVKMGVTRGYPDGTFRGTQDISRFEVASFLGKLGRTAYGRSVVEDKLLREVRSELALIKYEQDRAEKSTAFSGSLNADYRTATGADRGGNLDYRLRFSLWKRFSESSRLRVGLDTMDTGFNIASARDLSTRLIEAEGQFRLGGFDLSVALGPGWVRHTDAYFPSDNNTVFARPRTAVTAFRQIGRLSCSASYVVRQTAVSGRVGVQELTGKLKYKFGNTAVSFQPRCVYELDGLRDMLAEVGINHVWNGNYITYLLLAAGNFRQSNSGLYAKVVQKIVDPYNTGTTVVLRFDKVGSKYRDDYLDEHEFIDLNNFDRLILDGTVDLGLKVLHKLGDELALECKGDYVTNGDYQYGAAYPGTYFIWQLGLNYQYSSAIALKTFYRSYSVPSGLAQFSDPVPARSDVVGLGAAWTF